MLLRIPKELAVSHFFLIKAVIILFCRIDHAVMIRLICLDHSLARHTASACSSDCLYQKLERTLAASVIRCQK